MKVQPPEGLKVQYEYIRDDEKTSLAVHPRRTAEGFNGTTRAIVLDADDNVVAEGVASCCPKDNFSRATGRDAALGRALKHAGLHPRQR